MQNAIILHLEYAAGVYTHLLISLSPSLMYWSLVTRPTFYSLVMCCVLYIYTCLCMHTLCGWLQVCDVVRWGNTMQCWCVWEIEYCHRIYYMSQYPYIYNGIIEQNTACVGWVYMQVDNLYLHTSFLMWECTGYTYIDSSQILLLLLSSSSLPYFLPSSPIPLHYHLPPSTSLTLTLLCLLHSLRISTLRCSLVCVIIIN